MMQLFKELFVQKKRHLILLMVLMVINIVLCVITAFYMAPTLGESHVKWSSMRSKLATEGTPDKAELFRQGKLDMDLLKTRIPEKRNFARILADLMEMASSNDLDAGGITYKPEPVKGQNLIAYSISMKTVGDYLSVKSFLSDLLAIDDLVVVDDVSMSNSDLLAEQVNMNLRMTVYLREGA